MMWKYIIIVLCSLPLPSPTKKWLLDKTHKTCSFLSCWFNFLSWISKKLCNSSMESLSIFLAFSIELTTKLNFGVNDQIIFSMMVISYVLLSWICILLMFFIVLEKKSMTNSPIFTLWNLNFVWNVWSCCFFALVFSWYFFPIKSQISLKVSLQRMFSRLMSGLLKNIIFFCLEIFQSLHFYLCFLHICYCWSRWWFNYFLRNNLWILLWS